MAVPAGRGSCTGTRVVGRGRRADRCRGTGGCPRRVERPVTRRYGAERPGTGSSARCRWGAMWFRECER